MIADAGTVKSKPMKLESDESNQKLLEHPHPYYLVSIAADHHDGETLVKSVLASGVLADTSPSFRTAALVKSVLDLLRR